MRIHKFAGKTTYHNIAHDEDVTLWIMRENGRVETKKGGTFHNPDAGEVQNRSHDLLWFSARYDWHGRYEHSGRRITVARKAFGAPTRTDVRFLIDTLEKKFPNATEIWLEPDVFAALGGGRGVRETIVESARTPYQRLPVPVQDDIANELIERFPTAFRDLDAHELKYALADAWPDVTLDVRDEKISVLARSYRRTPSPVAVKNLRTKLRKGVVLDPILVSGRRFVDGGHRFKAYQEEGRETIPVVDIGPLLKTNWPKWLNGEARISEAVVHEQALPLYAGMDAEGVGFTYFSINHASSGPYTLWTWDGRVLDVREVPRQWTDHKQLFGEHSRKVAKAYGRYDERMKRISIRSEQPRGITTALLRSLARHFPKAEKAYLFAVDPASVARNVEVMEPSRESMKTVIARVNKLLEGKDDAAYRRAAQATYRSLWLLIGSATANAANFQKVFHYSTWPQMWYMNEFDVADHIAEPSVWNKFKPLLPFRLELRITDAGVKAFFAISGLTTPVLGVNATKYLEDYRDGLTRDDPFYGRSHVDLYAAPDVAATVVRNAFRATRASFIHEMIHYFDYYRYSKRDVAADTQTKIDRLAQRGDVEGAKRAYYSSNHEYNAHLQALISEIESKPTLFAHIQTFPAFLKFVESLMMGRTTSAPAKMFHRWQLFWSVTKADKRRHRSAIKRLMQAWMELRAGRSGRATESRAGAIHC